jgi:hypothetical protein
VLWISGKRVEKIAKIAKIAGIAKIERPNLTTDKHSAAGRTQKNLYGAQPPSAAGINLS